MMSWTSIITALTLTSLAAYLVILEHWPLWQAFGVVAGGALTLVLLLIAVVLARSTRDEREEFWEGFQKVIRDSLKG